MKNISFKVLIAIVALAVLLPSGSFAQGSLPDPADKFYVNDFANVMDAKTENELVHYGILLHK